MSEQCWDDLGCLERLLNPFSAKAYSRVGANLTDVKFEECYADGTGHGPKLCNYARLWKDKIDPAMLGAALFLRGSGSIKSLKVPGQYPSIKLISHDGTPR